MGRHTHGGAARALLAKSPITAPVAVGIVEIRICGNDDRIAALVACPVPDIAAFISVAETMMNQPIAGARTDSPLQNLAA
jgi:hypothetical protein